MPAADCQSVPQRRCIDCGKVENFPPGYGATSGMGWDHGSDGTTGGRGRGR